MPWTAVTVWLGCTKAWSLISSRPLSTSGPATGACWSGTCWEPLLRSELETRLVPGLTVTLALLMEAEAGVLGQDLPEWLDRVSSALPAESAFLTEMGWRVDPAGGGLLEENSGLSAGESLAAREFRDRLWSMAPPGSPFVTWWVVS